MHPEGRTGGNMFSWSIPLGIAGEGELQNFGDFSTLMQLVSVCSVVAMCKDEILCCGGGGSQRTCQLQDKR